VQDDPRRGQPKTQTKCGQSMNLSALRSKIMCDTYSRRIEYGNLFGGKDSNSGVTSGFSTIAIPLHMMY
jgi:hypothetical protein